MKKSKTPDGKRTAAAEPQEKAVAAVCCQVKTKKKKEKKKAQAIRRRFPLGAGMRFIRGGYEAGLWVTICLTVFEFFVVSDEAEVGVVVGVSEEGVVAACFAFSSTSSLSDPSEAVEQASEEGEEDEDSGLLLSTDDVGELALAGLGGIRAFLPFFVRTGRGTDVGGYGVAGV